jgi:hypothetical protein
MPRVQFVNLDYVPDAGVRGKDVYINQRLVLADAGFGAVSYPFSLSADEPALVRIQSAGTPFNPGSNVGTVQFPAGASGLIAYAGNPSPFVSGLMRLVDTRSVDPASSLHGSTVLFGHNVVHANGAFEGFSAAAGTVGSSGLTVVQNNIAYTANVSLASSTWSATSTTLGVRFTSGSFWRSRGFDYTNRLGWTFASQLNQDGDVRFVRVSAPWTAYGMYLTNGVDVPCEQIGMTACTPCQGNACPCPAGVHGCP